MHIIRFDDNYRIKSKLIVLDDLDELDAVPIKQQKRRRGGGGGGGGGVGAGDVAGWVVGGCGCHFKPANPLIRF